MKHAVMIIILLLCAAAFAQQNEATTPKNVENKVNELGAKIFVREYYGSEVWGALFYGIARGETAWLNLVKDIAEGTDAGSASELSDAVAWALPKAPEQVLLLSSQIFIFNRTCYGPPVDEPPDGMESYLKDSILAVSNITDPDLQKLKNSCLEQLRSIERMHLE